MKTIFEKKKTNGFLKRNVAAIVLLILSSTIFAQTETETATQKENYNEVDFVEEIILEGPRIGFTILSNPIERTFWDEPGKVETIYSLTQMGWQFERRLFSTDKGDAVLFEFVPLIAGLERSLFLPSMSGLIGYRTNEGFEIGAGPNLSLTGSSLVVAIGYTAKNNDFFIPFNLSYSSNRGGGRVSLLVGFNSKSKNKSNKWYRQ